MLTVFLLIILLTGLGLYISVNSDLRAAENSTLKLVEKDYQVSQVTEFYWVTINETSYSMKFVDKVGQTYYAIMNQDATTPTYYSENDLISQQDAESIAASDLENTRILNTRLGLMDNDPTWEIVLKNEDNTLIYYRLDARDGTWKQKIDGI